MQLVTTILVAINVLIFLLMYKENPAALWAPSRDLLIISGADFGPLTIQSQSWRLLTSGFVHIGVLHLVLNMSALMNLGSILESEVGVLKYLIIYFISLIAGSLLGLYFHPCVISAGASGAIFGLLGCQIIVMLGFWRQIPKTQLISGLFSQLIWIGLYITIGCFFPQIDNYAHIGGFIGGIAASLVLIPLNAKNKLPNIFNIIGLTILILALYQAYTYIIHAIKENPEVLTACETAQIKSILKSNKLPCWFPKRFASPTESLGAASLQCPDFKTAIELANNEVQLDPDNAYSYYNRALVQHKFNNDSTGLADMNKAITLIPHEYSFIILRARMETVLNQYDKAINDAQSALKIERPEHAEAKDIIGCYQLTRGNVEEAINWFNKAIIDNNQLGSAYYHRGIAQTIRHDKLKAKQDFIRAQERHYILGKWEKEHARSTF
jgi:membrane associated rhomboid family serine protease